MGKLADKKQYCEIHPKLLRALYAWNWRVVHQYALFHFTRAREKELRSGKPTWVDLLFELFSDCSMKLADFYSIVVCHYIIVKNEFLRKEENAEIWKGLKHGDWFECCFNEIIDDFLLPAVKEEFSLRKPVNAWRLKALNVCRKCFYFCCFDEEKNYLSKYYCRQYKRNVFNSHGCKEISSILENKNMLKK